MNENNNYMRVFVDKMFVFPMFVNLINFLDMSVFI